MISLCRDRRPDCPKYRPLFRYHGRNAAGAYRMRPYGGRTGRRGRRPLQEEHALWVTRRGRPPGRPEISLISPISRAICRKRRESPLRKMISHRRAGAYLLANGLPPQISFVSPISRAIHESPLRRTITLVGGGTLTPRNTVLFFDITGGTPQAARIRPYGGTISPCRDRRPDGPKYHSFYQPSPPSRLVQKYFHRILTKCENYVILHPMRE